MSVQAQAWFSWIKDFHSRKRIWKVVYKMSAFLFRTRCIKSNISDEFDKKIRQTYRAHQLPTLANETTTLFAPSPHARNKNFHYSDVIMSVMASQITGVSIVYSTLCSGADQRKHQSSASLAFVRGIHRSPVNSLHKGPVTWKMFPFHDVSMFFFMKPENVIVNTATNDQPLNKMNIVS